MADKDPIFSHLFFAVPELFYDVPFLKFLKANDYITDEGLEFLQQLSSDKARFDRIRKRIKGKSVFERLMSIAPELMSVSTVNLLRRFDYINERDGHILRLVIRGVGAIRGGRDSDDVMKRAARLLGIGFSEELVNLLRSADMIDLETARKMRIAINSTDAAVTLGTKALRAKSMIDWLSLAKSGLINESLLRALKLSGVINVRTANSLIEAVRYGGALWTVWEGAQKADGLAGRMAYVVSGSFSWEAIDFLEAIGVMNKKYRFLLKTAVAVSQVYNRRLMEQLTNRRYRIQPGEAPIKTFARASKQSTDDLLRLLAEAARESSKDVRQMKGLTASQRAIRTASLHRTMRELWEGVGHLTIFGERDAAEAAEEAVANMQRAFTRQLPEDIRRMLNIQAKASLDAYISRQENRIQLSRRVYGNINLLNGKLDKRINILLLKGASAEEIAKDVQRFINPNVSGGVKYAALRLGRTELANAFHTTTIRRGREMPWVQGWKWNLSSSHGRPDICNDYANDDHDGLGAGVFKKANIPGKPHPQCLCYLTAVQVDEEKFISNMKRGFYNQYMTQMINNQDVRATVGEAARARAAGAMAAYVLPAAASAYVKARAS